MPCTCTGMYGDVRSAWSAWPQAVGEHVPEPPAMYMSLQWHPALPRVRVPVLSMHSCTGHKELKICARLLYESLPSLVWLVVMDFQRAKRSFVWEHFARKGKDSARCKLCHKDFAHHGATTNLKEHLRCIHKEVLP